MLSTLEDLLGREPSGEIFAELTRLLDGLYGQELQAALARADTLLAAWPDELRASRAAWEQIQQGARPPAWWSLVRHVRVESGETLDVNRALASLTSVDASAADVDPAPLAAARHLRSLDLGANGAVVNLDFLSGTPALERLFLASLPHEMDLTRVFELRKLRELDLSAAPGLFDAGALRPLRELRYLNLSSTACGATLSALSALPALATLVIDDCDGLRDLTWVASLPQLRELVAKDVRIPVRLDELAAASLRSLTLTGKKIVRASQEGNLVALQELTLTHAPRLADLSFLNQLRGLRRLYIEGGDVRLPRLDLPVLDTLVLGWGTRVTDLAPLAELRTLTQLRIHQGRLGDLSPLAHLDKLEILALQHCTELGDLAPLASLPLRLCDLTGSGPLPDAVPVPPGCEVIR